MICVIPYLENSYKTSFADLKKRVEKYYVLNKEGYPITVTAVESLIFNYQLNYNFNRQYQYQDANNQLIFAPRGKTGDDEGETEEDMQKTKKP